MSPSTQDKSRLPSEFEAIKSEHIESGMNSKSVQKMSEKPNLDTSAKHSKKAIVGKSDSRYWLQPGKLLSDPRWSGSYSCKIQVQSRRESFPLRTVNKNTAASKAARIYCDIVALGWEAAIAKHKPDSAKPDKGSTVGDLFAAVSELANVRPPTLRSYMATFRRIVADVMSIEAKAGRYARCGSGRADWLAAVDAVPLEKLTPDRIEAWKLRYVSIRATGDEVKARSARNSANSLLRMGKGLFAKKLVQHIEARIKLPAKLPFDGVGLFPRQSMRYVSTMDVKAVLAAARDEFASEDPEAFKAFTLCLLGGLRRNEADKLRWSSVDFEAGVIRVEAQSDFAPKAETSLDDVPIDMEVCAILRGLRSREPEAEYVLAADAPKRKFKLPRPTQTSQDRLTWSRYRAEDTFSRLVRWLREHGVNTQKPLHTLRKEAGSLICEEHGLFASSRFLRHADVAITAQHYAARKQRVTVGLGSVLTSSSGKIVAFSAEPEVKVASTAPKKARAARTKVV